ncbi:hypothetical protein [Microcoleus sp. S36b_A4]|uniref:hypothetical protein n=1 Tax=Microcoleus sp. S36b_A4 TaxID=3055420 RepID=UPI002FD691A6
MADTANTCEVSPTSSLSEVFRQDDREKGSNNLKYYFEHESAWGVKMHQCQQQAFGPVPQKLNFLVGWVLARP